MPCLQAGAGAQLAPSQTPEAGEPGGAERSTFMRLGVVEAPTNDGIRGTYAPCFWNGLSVGRVFEPSLHVHSARQPVHTCAAIRLNPLRLRSAGCSGSSLQERLASWPHMAAGMGMGGAYPHEFLLPGYLPPGHPHYHPHMHMFDPEDVGDEEEEEEEEEEDMDEEDVEVDMHGWGEVRCSTAGRPPCRVHKRSAHTCTVRMLCLHLTALARVLVHVRTRAVRNCLATVLRMSAGRWLGWASQPRILGASMIFAAANAVF
jgi:hypothetical protein